MVSDIYVEDVTSQLKLCLRLRGKGVMSRRANASTATSGADKSYKQVINSQTVRVNDLKSREIGEMQRDGGGDAMQ